MKIDVFDFDGTIYDGDSTVDFLKFCLVRRPWLAFCLVPPALSAAASAVSGRFSLTRFKSALFGALAKRIRLREEGEAFWQREKTKKKLGEWFLERERTLPVVIASASPDFELLPAARLLRADRLICTRCDPETGRLLSANCKGEEKIRRIREEMGACGVRAMYTDDEKADGPLLSIAEEKYLVTHGQVRAIS